MTQIDNVLYTGKTHITGGRNGSAKSADGVLDIALAYPKELGGSGNGANPEQLLGAGWSACFIGAMTKAATARHIKLPANLAVDAEVDLGMTGEAYHLQARLTVSLPGLDAETQRYLVDTAHQTCPYSKALKGNINIEIKLAQN